MSLSPSYVASFRTDTVVGFSLGRPRSIEFQFQFEHKGSIQLLGVIKHLDRCHLGRERERVSRFHNIVAIETFSRLILLLRAGVITLLRRVSKA